MTPRIRIFLDGTEADWIARALREAQMVVLADEAEETPQVIVIDREHPELVAQIKASPHAVVVGWDAFSKSESEALPEHHFMERPVSASHLIQHVRSLEHFEADELSSPGVDQTVQLRASELPRARVSSVSALAVDASVQNFVSFSDVMRRRIDEAAERLFPGQELADLRLAVGSESWNLKSLDVGEFETSHHDLTEDPLKDFTFVGAPDLLDSIENTPHAETAPSELSEHGTQATHGTHPALTREGLLPVGGALRLCWKLRDDRGYQLRLQIPGEGAVSLDVEGGVVTRMSGFAQERLAKNLREEGLLSEMTDTEEGAARAIETLVERGALSRFERDRRLRVLRERALGEFTSSLETSYALAEARHGGPSILSAPIVAVICEQLRCSMGAEEALRGLQITMNHRLWLGAVFDEVCEAARLEPELRVLLREHAGSPVHRVLVSAPGVGVGGVLFAMGVLEALRFEEGESQAIDASAVRSLIEGLHQKALDGTYFEVLDVSTSASPREIDAAYEHRVASMKVLDLDGLGLGDLEGARVEILEAASDAHLALSSERVRTAYVAALESPS